MIRQNEIEQTRQFILCDKIISASALVTLLGQQMPFWKKPIELPENFYRAAGEFLLWSLMVAASIQKLEGVLMTFDEAYELLDRTKGAGIKLRTLIAQYPIETVSKVDLQDKEIELVIQSCDEKKRLIELWIDGSMPIRHCGIIDGRDAIFFERGVIGTATNLVISEQAAMKQMAKSANMSLNQFTGLASRAFKDTTEGLLMLGEVQAIARMHIPLHRRAGAN